ncbi:hypothetical protein G6F22_021437 [Rhizopus arrhizus]|nr:hypothetical protein G6F22_021437 [Rhizopus arrhizus]
MPSCGSKCLAAMLTATLLVALQGAEQRAQERLYFVTVLGADPGHDDDAQHDGHQHHHGLVRLHATATPVTAGPAGAATDACSRPLGSGNGCIAGGSLHTGIS